MKHTKSNVYSAWKKARNSYNKPNDNALGQNLRPLLPLFLGASRYTEKTSSARYCSFCGICCEKTEMLLSFADIKRLEGAGYIRSDFMRFDRHGFARLKNRHGVCTFHDPDRKRCKTCRHRPAGCRVYPVIYNQKEGIIVDTLCPMETTISRTELKRKSKKVIELLNQIDAEVASYRHQIPQQRKLRRIQPNVR